MRTNLSGESDESIPSIFYKKLWLANTQKIAYKNRKNFIYKNFSIKIKNLIIIQSQGLGFWGFGFRV